MSAFFSALARHRLLAVVGLGLAGVLLIGAGHGEPSRRVVRGAAAFLAASTTPTTSTAPSPTSLSPSPSLSPSSASPSGGSSSPPGIEVGPPLPSAPARGAPGGSLSTGSDSGGGCGFFSVSCHITQAIDGWFAGLVTSALNPTLALLGRSVLATPRLTTGRVADLWGVAAGIANAVVVLLVLAGGAIVMGHETLQTRYGAKEIAPRIVVALVAANASLAIVGEAIPIANALSQALLGPGVDPADAGAALSRLVNASVASGGIFLVFVGLVAAVLAVVLLATYVIRVALLVLLVAGAPLMLICHALPQTEGAARLWWRAVAGLFAIQLGQSLVLITALRVFLASNGHAALGLSAGGGLVDMLVATCLLWVLVRIPAWVARAAFGAGRRSSGVGRTIKTVVVYRAVRAALGALA